MKFNTSNGIRAICYMLRNAVCCAQTVFYIHCVFFFFLYMYDGINSIRAMAHGFAVLLLLCFVSFATRKHTLETKRNETRRREREREKRTSLNPVREANHTSVFYVSVCVCFCALQPERKRQDETKAPKHTYSQFMNERDKIENRNQNEKRK